MKLLLTSCRAWALLGLPLVFGGCKEDPDALPGIIGTWQLTHRQCFCAPAPVPNETVEFTGDEFAFYTDGQLTSRGTYTFTTGSVCGGNTPVPVVRFTQTAGSTIGGPLQATYELNGPGQTLVLDYGSPCDAPRNTYGKLL